MLFRALEVELELRGFLVRAGKPKQAFEGLRGLLGLKLGNSPLTPCIHPIGIALFLGYPEEISKPAPNLLNET